MSELSGFSLEVFKQRRRALLTHLGEEGVAVLTTAPEQRRNRDTHYHYRPDSDFVYLTGFAEPEAVLVLAPGRSEGEVVLFCRPKDEAKEIWDGYRVGPEAAPNQLGVDQAFDIAELLTMMPKLLEGRRQLHYDFGEYPAFDQSILAWMQEIKTRARLGARAPEQMTALSAYLHEARLIKSEAELGIMRQACDITARAHVKAMKACRPGGYEYQLEAAIAAECMGAGARFSAYPAIVGAGSNACILHYIDNTARLDDGNLVLIDAGAELHFYAADITRTFPVNGNFSAEQKALYEVVLAAQEASIEALKVGAAWSAYDEKAVKLLTEGMLDLGLLTGEVDSLIEDKAYKRFYMHRTGHWLGLDVHDVGQYKVGGQWRPLVENMVVTVEPGLYISPTDESVDARWRGIGIRIEDDVIVKQGGPEVMTAGVPKTVQAIEALMAEV